MAAQVFLPGLPPSLSDIGGNDVSVMSETGGKDTESQDGTALMDR